jgi:hypothetical protein
MVPYAGLNLRHLTSFATLKPFPLAIETVLGRWIWCEGRVS